MTTPMLEVRDLHVRIAEREILKGVNLIVPKGEVHAIMGRNGSGKSTLSYVLAGKPDYEVTHGEVLLDGVSLLELEPSERATAGLFLAFQYPIEIPGVATMTFLKAAMNAKRRANGETDMTTPEFMRAVKEAGASLHIDSDMLKRALNVGFSGGEKKRAEILQMALLKPKMCILDETDSGLDIDALKVVANGVNELVGPDMGAVVITHYQRILNYITPDHVHVFVDGRIVASGGAELAKQLEAEGYEAFIPAGVGGESA